MTQQGSNHSLTRMAIPIFRTRRHRRWTQLAELCDDVGGVRDKAGRVVVVLSGVHDDLREASLMASSMHRRKLRKVRTSTDYMQKLHLTTCTDLLGVNWRDWHPPE